ncbi:DUF3488 domain-containing transglutaminase family protein [Marinobacterium sp. AK62]|uniref:DUF3488 domain-containing transglutaminase family protein n=1 Tax=Marinobacterium alkalitolerans TaxID=1542925 RepID=A0ABS3ZCT3_9GAMM|nr:DUF3488 and transglutaminase-like domain-containing protein [Marinobacterium alkalitolerans]MBP0049507.1 DUF3488 domain-containing transglutaminase family protein [Marinobacterium alkalitolerans]
MKGQQISRSAVMWQLLACVLVSLPHLSWLPAWIPVLLMLTLGARVMMHLGRWSLPSRTLKLVLVVAATLGLIFSFGQQAGPETMVALLVVSMALKLIEIYRRRDALVLIYVAFFVLGTAFLFSSSVWTALYALAALVVVLAALLSIHQRDGVSALQTLRRVLLLAAPALPLMVLLFLVFPRLEPLWSVTLDSGGATTGLSDTLSPGDVSQLAQSDELAFRVTFDAEPPVPAERYWRVLVLDRFDGRQWSRSPQRERLRQEKLEPLGGEVRYEVVLEPSQRPWLVALDQPLAVPDWAAVKPGRTLEAREPVERRVRYTLVSHRRYRLQPMLTQQERAHYLQLPERGNGEARALARQWLAQAGGDSAAFIALMLNYYNQSFTYTLSPGRLLGDRIDRFLMESQQGYCEHFASASAFMLRSVGIPARVVTGYQGGEWNPHQSYLQVRQYDAHAWVEAWQEGRGWVRIDPTAAVAPERIESSADVFLRSVDSGQVASRALQTGWLLGLRQRYDAFNFAWQRWVLNYEGEQEHLLRDWLGGLDYWRVAAFLLLPGGLVLVGLSMRQWMARTLRRGDPVEAALIGFQQRAGACFSRRQPQQSLSAWIHSDLVPHWPEAADELMQLAELDNARRYRYGAQDDQDQAILALTRRLAKQLPRRTRVV